MDGAQVEIREQESCFCRTQVPLVFGIAHGYSLTSFALDLYPLEQFNSEQMCSESTPNILIKICRKFNCGLLVSFINKTWGSATSFLINGHNKAKISGVFHWISHCHGNLLRQDN